MTVRHDHLLALGWRLIANRATDMMALRDPRSALSDDTCAAILARSRCLVKVSHFVWKLVLWNYDRFTGRASRVSGS